MFFQRKRTPLFCGLRNPDNSSKSFVFKPHFPSEIAFQSGFGNSLLAHKDVHETSAGKSNNQLDTPVARF